MLRLIISSLLLHYSSSSILDSRYTKGTLCDTEERLSNGCSKKLDKVAGVLKCVSLCNQNQSCFGASVDENGYCFVHFECPYYKTCVVRNTNHIFLSRFCVHGTWNASTSSCQCVKAYTGERCDRYPKDCEALKTLGYPTGYHRVYIDPDEDGVDPVLVVCDVSLPSWFSIIFMRNEGNMNFNRTWSEYRRGFYVDTVNLWGGLDTWALLSKIGYRSIFVMNFKDGKSLHRTYWDLTFTNASEWYKLRFSSTSTGGTKSLTSSGFYYGDCLSPVQNKPFSTWDADNDGDGSSNCAAKSGSGWWYSGCFNPCNVLGLGIDHWASKPPYQLFSVPNLDMNTWASLVQFMEIYLQR